MMGAFFNWGKQKVAICMSGTATPRWMPVYKDNIVAQVCEGVRTPHAEPVLKTMQEHYPSFPSCQPQHFRRRGNCCYLSGTREAVKFIEHFMDCKSSVRSRREAQDINRLVPLGSRCRATPKRRNPRRSMAPRKHQAHPGAVPFPHHESQVKPRRVDPLTE